MKRILKRTGIATTITAITAVSVLAFGGVAYADIIQDSIEGSASVTLVAGSETAGSATMRLNANGKSDGDIGCNIDAGDSPLKLTVVAPSGVTASPNPVVITNCTDDFPVSFTAGTAAQSGTVTVLILAQPAGGGEFKNQVGIPIIITQPVPTNTAPSVSVNGVSNGASYEIGTVPTATCLVVDAEDVNPTAASVTTGALLNGLGTQTTTCDYTDAGGLNAPTATVTYTVVDTVDPTIGYTLNPVDPDGTNGWYTTDSGVLVHFACEDVGGSGIATCPADVILMDGADQSVTGTATDNAGNTASVTVSGITVDTVDPTISYTLDPADANANGWYTSFVTVDFTCTDVGGSGIAACPADITLTDGVNNVTGTATDNAGNTADATAAVVNIDTVDPTISYTLNPVAPEGNDGWYTTDAGVIVHFTCEDVGGSGIATCPGDTTLHDGANRSVTGTVTDKAGNTTTVTTTGINIDSVDPTISSTLDPAAPNAAGWYAADVVVGFTCRDAGSGIATCAGDVTLVEGAGQSVTGAATDRAGNTATASVSGIDIDTTAPTVALLGGPTGSYQYGSNPAAPSCYATDALSGIASCVVTGGGTRVGDHSYLATATDTAGNTSTSRVAYTVLAWSLKGFYAPVDMGANVWNTVKGGSSVPLKFEIFSGAELTSVSAVKSFTATAVTCPGSSAVTDAIELTTTGGTSLRYDSTSGQFIQNWQTPKKPGTCAVVTMTAQDGSTISANFMLK
ncbi:PxKF domain-containing protein [Cryobacterium sp. TMT2-4]|nr:PxKF domain-containing protein [Cryobacterium sp. TMT2-4]TFC68975.1 hypothetical protein E3O54_05795 [Cryobacterium sp. TMT2-4]